MQKEERYWHWFCSSLFPHRRLMERLLERFGTPEAVFEAELSQLLEADPEQEEKIRILSLTRTQWNFEKKEQELTEKGIRFVSCEHPEFPERLRQIPDSPRGIFYKGRLPGEEPSLAIVGARNCSAYGRNLALSFGEELGRCGVQIVSGMARGVDGFGHRGALRGGGRTFAVLGGGVDICYPKENRDLYEELQRSGGILSEAPPGTYPARQLFPLRNRIISGLGDAVLIIEAKLRSGSLITADQALEQGKDLYAVPGRLGESLSEGCNRLIYQGAGIALSPECLAEALGCLSDFNRKKGEKNKLGLKRQNICCIVI